MTDDQEEWRDCVACDAYEVSSHGRVRSLDRRVLGRWGSTRLVRGRILALAANTKGYLFFGVCVDGSQRPHYVHTAVAEAFHGPRPPGLEVRHRNGDKSNNRADNILWGTRSQNAMDRVEHGTMLRGESHPNKKLTDDAVRLIRSSQQSAVQLASDLGVNHTTVARARRGETWGHSK